MLTPKLLIMWVDSWDIYRIMIPTLIILRIFQSATRRVCYRQKLCWRIYRLLFIRRYHHLRMLFDRRGGRTYSSIGGFAGCKYSSLSFRRSYWDIDTSNLGYSDGGTGRSTDEMQHKDYYDSWDWTSVWANEEGAGYPYLRAIPLNVCRIRRRRFLRFWGIFD